MKEATGELNMTVITVVAIAAVAALFYAFLWPNIQTSLKSNTICANGPQYKVGSKDAEGYVSCGALNSKSEYSCSYTTKENNKIVEKKITCKQK